MDFGLTRDATDSVECIAVRGDIDIHTAPAVINMLRKVYDDGARRLVLDLSDVTFLDSSGVGAVFIGHAEARERDAGFACVHGSQLEKFSRMGLEGLITLVGSREEALALLR